MCCGGGGGVWSLLSPPIATSHRANRGPHCVPAAAAPSTRACFSYFPFISETENLIPASTNTGARLFTASPPPTAHTPPLMPLPRPNCLHYPRLACHSHCRPPLLHVPCTCPFPIPPCGHLNCPCRGVGSVSIFTPSPPCFHPDRQSYASFIWGTERPIFSCWPRAATVLLHSVRRLLAPAPPPRGSSCGCGSLAELEWALQAHTHIQPDLSFLAVCGTVNLKKMTNSNRTGRRTETEEQARVPWLNEYFNTVWEELLHEKLNASEYRSKQLL